MFQFAMLVTADEELAAKCRCYARHGADAADKHNHVMEGINIRRLDGLQAAIRVPILHLVRETVSALSAEHPTHRRFGLLATSGTLQSRMFEAKFEPEGLTIFPCEPGIQVSCVMEAIYAVKKGESLDRPRRLIREAAAHLLERGAEAVIAGCTEIPLILSDGDLRVPIIDPTWILARAAVRRALAAGPQVAPGRPCYKDRG